MSQLDATKSAVSPLFWIFITWRPVSLEPTNVISITRKLLCDSYLIYRWMFSHVRNCSQLPRTCVAHTIR